MRDSLSTWVYSLGEDASYMGRGNVSSMVEQQGVVGGHGGDLLEDAISLRHSLSQVSPQGPGRCLFSGTYSGYWQHCSLIPAALCLTLLPSESAHGILHRSTGRRCGSYAQRPSLRDSVPSR